MIHFSAASVGGDQGDHSDPLNREQAVYLDDDFMGFHGDGRLSLAAFCPIKLQPLGALGATDNASRRPELRSTSLSFMMQLLGINWSQVCTHSFLYHANFDVPPIQKNKRI